ncbi:GNAT family N-acetyltransferase [Alicyclobacillus shizuokensis]|uniref:GNAT family N-acetyltransferase n=1 Tax=Alicyclobacillus shizuokensis TaxID=392014 RepID=UPI000829DD60|nr:GNAT family N-acetyltransferase [Alicyclobacillus shizuokensis]MCL6627116.1 GNAT family N-acetyltransferase [Alicyclobacillus shizuokensis]
MSAPVRRYTLADGRLVEIRPARRTPAERRRLWELLQRESPESLYLRFFRCVRAPDERLIDSLLPLPSHASLTLVCLQDGRMVGIGSYQAVDAQTVELAALVADAEQGRGIGSLLLSELMQSAAANGYRRAVVHVLWDNRRSLRLLTKHQFRRQSSAADLWAGEAVLTAPLQTEARGCTRPSGRREPQRPLTGRYAG